MTNTCRQVIKMIAEKNKKSLITPPSVKACVIIMIIGIVAFLPYAFTDTYCCIVPYH